MLRSHPLVGELFAMADCQSGSKSCFTSLCRRLHRQVWTGTSREPNFFDGRKRERVFETAYLEYGSMESMTAPTGRKMFFLTDPIEELAA